MASLRISEIRAEAERRVSTAPNPPVRRYWQTILEMCVGLQGLEDADVDPNYVEPVKPAPPQKKGFLDRLRGG